MRIIKLGIISVVVLGLLILAMSSLLPSTVYVTRTINLSVPADSVYRTINDLRKWKTWCVNMDSATVQYAAKTTGPGASMTVDKTTITIDSALPQTIIVSWRSQSGRPLVSIFDIKPGNTANLTSLQWQFINRVRWYPWEKFGTLLSDKALGGFMEKSLDKMKAEVEKDAQ